MVADNQSDEIQLLKEIARWSRLAALPALRETAKDLIVSDPQRRAYAAMDGATGVIAIEKATGANHNEIAKWLKLWAPAGLIDPDTAPPNASFSLVELGIEAPTPKVARPKKSTD